ncbi:MAG TPA: DUF2961 domain-containing protein, partial [Chloroflexota bacterium]|nr:DUF2961 domain-containing protein [Chloroflexota bacterium]
MAGKKAVLRVLAAFVVLVALFAVALPAPAAERGPVGLAALDQLERLPYLWVGRQAHHFSSHDLTGGNSDRGNYVSQTGLTRTLFDAKGAGCIYRFWTTNQYSSSNFTPTAHGNIQIFIDDNPTPVVDTTLANFFSGTYSAFQFPFAGSPGDSSGGFYSYLPIPYRTACRILWTAPSTDTPGMYYNIDYVTYDTPDGVTS